MARRFDTTSLVRLPHLDAGAAQALGSAVLSAAADRTLPGPVAEATAELKVAVDNLQGVAVQRLPSGVPDTRAADINLDAAWSALHRLLGAWARLPDHPHAQLAVTLRDLLFPDGLRFTRLPFRLEWTESENRIGIVDERGIAPRLEELGGAAALVQIRQAHARYGDVLSITAQAAQPPPGLRDARTAVMNALRLFVVRVIASVRSQDPPSERLARELLAPIETWEHPRSAPKADANHPATTAAAP